MNFSASNNVVEQKNIYKIGYVVTEFIIKTWNVSKIRELIEHYGNINFVLGISEKKFEMVYNKYIDEIYFSDI